VDCLHGRFAARVPRRNQFHALLFTRHAPAAWGRPEEPMNGIIYLIGLIVVIMAILSFLGLR